MKGATISLFGNYLIAKMKLIEILNPFLFILLSYLVAFLMPFSI